MTLVSQIRTLLSPAIVFEEGTVSGAPSWPGAYVILMQLPISVRFTKPGSDHVIAAGWYAYCGSAYGPGGVGARLRRHFRREKKPHWHVDQLTPVTDSLYAFAVRDGSECDLVSRLDGSVEFQFSVDGFGSSDCMVCRSHLLGWCGNRLS